MSVDIRNGLKILWLPVVLLLGFAHSTEASAPETRGVRVQAKDKATGQQGEVKLYNKSYAVIIGIDKYRNLPRDKELSYAVRDAKGVQMVLEKNFKFDKIIQLYDENATKENILKLLTVDLPSEMGNEDSLFVFWAGHGNQKESPEGPIGYLIPYDGSADEIYRNITMTEIRDMISKTLPAKHVFYVMDACYSGLLTTRSVDKATRRDLEYLKEITKERVRQVLTAGEKGQEVVDGGPKGHSVFTGRLIEVLENRGDFITANEIQTILKEKVYNDAKGMGHIQTPSFGSLSGNGDFVFIPSIEQKIEDNKAELVKMEQELKSLEALEASAKQSQSEMKQREVEQLRMAAEAKMKAEKLRQQQLQYEVRSNQELEADRIRFDAEQKKKEAALAAARTEEEQSMAALKIELEKKKQSVSIVSATGTIEAAVVEIKRLNAKIDEIEAALKKEFDDGRNRIETRYETEISSIKSLSRSKQIFTRDEFETEAEFNARIAKQTSGYDERVIELERKKKSELEEITYRFTDEQATQTVELRNTIKQLSEKEYALGAESLDLEIGVYDINKGSFPVSIKNKPTLPTSVVQVVMNGTLPLPKDAARKFKQEWESGLVRPQVKVKAGSQGIVGVELANDADGELIAYQSGEFIANAEKRKRQEEAAKILREEKRIGFRFEEHTALELKTGLRWTRYDNIAEKSMNWIDAGAYCRRLNQGGYDDWRLPTKDELEALAQYGKDAGYGKKISDYLNGIGFGNVKPDCYWTSSIPWLSDHSAWYVCFNNGYVFASNNVRNDELYVWCVRAGQ